MRILSALALLTLAIAALGAGSGALARTILSLLDDAGHGHVAYRILEPSPDLRARQADALSGYAQRVSWLDKLEPGSVTGAIIANEVADALPVDRVQRDFRLDVRNVFGVASSRFAAWLEGTATIGS